MHEDEAGGAGLGRGGRLRDVGDAAPLYRIACAPSVSCYVIARPETIMVTHDAAAHWAAHTLPLDI